MDAVPALVLAGRLEAVSLASVLQILAAGEATGVLCIERDHPPEKAEIAMARGRIIRAVRTPAAERLGATLVRRRAVPAAAVGEALKRQSAAPAWRPLGEVLVEMGAVDEGTLALALADQMERVTASVLAWERGVFRFRRAGGRSLAGAGTTVALEAGQLLMRAARHADERTRAAG